MEADVSVTIDVVGDGDARVVTVSGEIDADNCSSAASSLLEIEGDGLTLDLTNLGFIDSSGISELLRVRQLVIDRGGDFVLKNPSPAVHRILDITGLLAVFGLEA